MIYFFALLQLHTFSLVPGIEEGKLPNGLKSAKIFSSGHAKLTFNKWGSKLLLPVSCCFSFFIPPMKRMKRPPNSFFPTQKNFSVSNEYLIWRVSLLSYLSTTSHQSWNAILFKGNLPVETCEKNFCNMSPFPALFNSFRTDGISF